MTAEQFTYWLQGFFELSGATTLNEQQVKVVKDHIALVLKKETIQYTGITIAPNNPNIKLYPTNNYSTVVQDSLVDVPTNLTC
jgi:hypothetical protein